MAYRVIVEKSKISSLRLRQQAKTRNIKVIKYSRNSEQKRVTFIRNNEKDIKEKVIMCKEEDLVGVKIENKNNDNEKFDNDADSKV